MQDITNAEHNYPLINNGNCPLGALKLEAPYKMLKVSSAGVGYICGNT